MATSLATKAALLLKRTMLAPLRDLEENEAFKIGLPLYSLEEDRAKHDEHIGRLGIQ